MKNIKLTLLAATLALTAGVCAADNQTAEPTAVEVVLVNNLDGYLNGYCLDIKGGGKNINPADGLQVHTCYSYKGSLGKDQIFDTTRFAGKQLYLPNFDVCAEVSAIKNGATVALAECNNSELQQIHFAGNGTITPVSNPELCFTASLDTKRGRGGTSDHQIKGLSLEKCSDDKTIFQQWRTRTEKDS